MRRTVIVLVISTVLLWCTAALCRRPPATRWDGDPDEYQAALFHEEKYANPPDLPGRTSMSARPWLTLLGRLLWEVLHPGTSGPYRGEGR